MYIFLHMQTKDETDDLIMRLVVSSQAALHCEGRWTWQKVSSLPLRKLVFRVQSINNFRSEKLTAKLLFHKASWASLWSIPNISSDVCFSRISFFKDLAFLFVRTARNNIFRLSLAVIAPRGPPQGEEPYICLIRHIVFNQIEKN